VAVALPRHTEPSGDDAPRVGASDDEKRKTWRGERALMLFRQLVRLGTSLGSSPAAAAAAAPAPAAAAADPRFASGGVGVAFRAVDGGLDRGFSTPSSLTRRTDEYRWYRSAMRALVHDAIHIIPAVATAAADVLLSQMDISVIHASHNLRRAAGRGVTEQSAYQSADQAADQSAEQPRVGLSLGGLSGAPSFEEDRHRWGLCTCLNPFDP
jgi:hypothetical protein